MKISIFFIALCGLLLCCNCEQRNAIRILTRRFSNLADAVNNATNLLFDNNSISLNILSPKKNSLDLSDFKDELLSRQVKTSKLRITLESAGHFSFKGHVLKRGSVWVIRNYDDFLEIFKEITPKAFRLGGHFFLVMIRGELKELPGIFYTMWKQQIFNVFAMCEDANQEVLVKIFKPFNDEKCDDMTPILINKYKDGQFVNGTSNLLLRKMKNLHKCPVRVATSNNSEPYVFVKKSSNNSFALHGREISLVETLAETLNFKLEYTYLGTSGYIFDNGSATGALESLLIGEADISAVDWLLKDNRLKYFDRTTPYVYETIILLVPRGVDLTSYQQMLYPFDFYVWLMLCIFLLIGFIVIFVIKFQSKVVQNFVLGTGNRNPYTNMLIAFYGGSQTKLPLRNLARYLLMMFLIFSLVMRASYTGLFYNMLKSHERRGEAKTIQEMVQRDFKFYVNVGSTDLFDDTGALKNRTVILHQTDGKESEQLTMLRKDPNFKGAHLTALIKVVYRNKFLEPGEQFTVCREIFKVIPVVVYSRKNFYLLSEMNDKIETFKAAGLIQHWKYDDHEKNYLKRNKTRESRGLNLNQLRGSFQLLMVGCFCSLLAFAFEVLKSMKERSSRRNKIIYV